MQTAANENDTPLQPATTTETSNSHSRCLKSTRKLLNSSPILQFLQLEITKVNGKFQLSCQPCDDRKGGFDSNGNIIVCENQIASKLELEDTIAHELVHCYDHNTVELDYSNPLHVACTEIRANSLSRECRFYNEIKRGYLGIARHHQDCVKRRSVLGLMQSKSVGSKEEAETIVNQVFNQCFQDTAPFDEIY